MMNIASLPGASPVAADNPPVVWVHPRAWKADNRTRRYITLTERDYSRAADFDMLVRSMNLMLKRQDGRGSFHSDEEYHQYDKVDDQLGATSLLAYYLSRTGPHEAIGEALERAVRFHLDHLVFRSPDRPFRYSRVLIDRDTPGDWCNTLWCLGSGSTVLRFGTPFLTPRTAADLREVLADCWRFVSIFPTRDENPCHNQLLAYCEIGTRVGDAIGDQTLRPAVLDYYHRHLRRLRIQDRGHRIYSEFGKWDIHYGVLSWIILESFFVVTGDPAIREDADEMALYFNEQVSAGGYYWGGTRNNECGVDEFPHLFTARDAELGFSRLLFPEPSHLWRQMTVDGHGGSGLVGRIETVLPSRETRRPSLPTSWHFQTGDVSVCLQDDSKTHHVSSAGLELISVPSAGGVTSGLRWLKDGVWKEDLLQVHPPGPSERLSYYDSRPIHLAGVAGVTSMQRGFFWETRQWWLSSGNGLLWVGQLITHFSPQCDQIHFVLGNPVVTRVAGRPVPVAEVETEEGTKADTQGEAIIISSPYYLRFGDVFVGATAPLEFVRPAREAFHTFPSPLGHLWRDFTSSNELRLLISKTPQQLETRVSLFFGVEIGRETPSLEISQTPLMSRVASRLGCFVARQSEGIWHYMLEREAAPEALPSAGFGYRPVEPAMQDVAP